MAPEGPAGQTPRSEGPRPLQRVRGPSLLEGGLTVSAWTTLFPQPAQPLHGHAAGVGRVAQRLVGQLLQRRRGWGGYGLRGHLHGRLWLTGGVERLARSEPTVDRPPVPSPSQ